MIMSMMSLMTTTTMTTTTKPLTSHGRAIPASSPSRWIFPRCCRFPNGGPWVIIRLTIGNAMIIMIQEWSFDDLGESDHDQPLVEVISQILDAVGELFGVRHHPGLDGCRFQTVTNFPSTTILDNWNDFREEKPTFRRRLSRAAARSHRWWGCHSQRCRGRGRAERQPLRWKMYH